MSHAFLEDSTAKTGLLESTELENTRTAVPPTLKVHDDVSYSDFLSLWYIAKSNGPTKLLPWPTQKETWLLEEPRRELKSARPGQLTSGWSGRLKSAAAQLQVVGRPVWGH